MSTWVVEFRPSYDGGYVSWSIEDRDAEYSFLTGEYGHARTLWGAKRQAKRALHRVQRVDLKKQRIWAEIDALSGRIDL